jgi:predicted ABC-type ATPase
MADSSVRAFDWDSATHEPGRHFHWPSAVLEQQPVAVRGLVVPSKLEQGVSEAGRDAAETLSHAWRDIETAAAPEEPGSNPSLEQYLPGANFNENVGRAAIDAGEGLVSLAAAVPAAALQKALGGDFDVGDARQTIKQALPNLVTGHRRAQAIEDVAALPATIPAELVGNTAFDVTNPYTRGTRLEPVSAGLGAVGQVIGSIIGPKAFAKITNPRPSAVLKTPPRPPNPPPANPKIAIAPPQAGRIVSGGGNRIPELTDQERRIAAEAAGVQPREVPPEVGEVAHLIDTDPDSALRIHAEHPENPDAFMAAVGERSRSNAEAGKRPQAQVNKETAQSQQKVPKKLGTDQNQGVPVSLLDAPNFGMPEPPRPLPEGDPLLEQTQNINTPERQALRDRIVDQHFVGVEPATGRKPIAYVMGGGGGGGKDTTLHFLRDRGVIPRKGIVEIDPDTIKTGGKGIEGLPEYQKLIALGDSRAAEVVHAESADLANRVRNRATKGGYDLLLNRTLGDVPSTLKELNALRNAGYEVRLYGVTVDPRNAILRAVERAKEGRYVPMQSLLWAHKGFANGFEQYAQVADRATLFDNDVPQGTAPIPTASKLPNNALQVEDAQRYNRFKARRNINEHATTFRQLDSR